MPPAPEGFVRLVDVSKSYDTRKGRVSIFRDVNLEVRRGEKVGILGRNGAGKSTMIRLISGAERPTTGKVERTMSVSWPLAFGGAFQSSLTGLDNLRFIARVYGTTPEDKIDFVEEFSELGTYFREPVRHYSAGMRARLAFAISMVVEFDCFLIDEIVAVGDARFTEKCRRELFEKRGDRTMIIVSHDRGFIRDFCEHAAVLAHGELKHFENVGDAYDYYGEQMQ
ncbi:ABC transporter ATP-binding protein [Sphingomonas sinipercae]|uniref:ABC transporter ATP-binding protein n=1 Tax=Sphingomonas sinipercae TaxID=2714944 RepID=A0A6G7ZQP7_9SPHN|nr:ABC transporter ATP-binding protein [Sphingomonas sinipercae]